jgi:hypothetical protein
MNGTALNWMAMALMAAGSCGFAAESGRWPAEQAKAWGDAHGWLVGCNFSPSSAINQLEMWQKESFDRAALDRELGWAESLGFNSLRVFLHSLAWQQDPQGFLARMDEFLALADKHHIGVMFVFFDSCWHPVPKSGTQPAPKPHVHNSGWVQDPGAAVLQDPAAFEKLKPYVQSVVTRFRSDKRVHAWDVWNEPDNTNDSSYGAMEPKDKAELMLPKLAQAFAWLREINPSQPLTSGVWKGNWAEDAKLSPTERTQLENSDVISFHAYGNAQELSKRIESLRRYGRPLLCTEYMARPAGSAFDPNLGVMKQAGVAAYNWGFVSGKTQTIYPWDSWRKAYTAEPPVWFHDIFRTDGTPYIQKEVDYIRALTGQAPARK